MNKYELMFIISADANDEEKETIIEKVRAEIEAKGAVEGIDKMGMRKFAYPINFKNEGYYVVVNFSAQADLIAELNRTLLINEKVVRQLFVRKDA